MSVSEEPPASDLSLRDLARFAEGEARRLAATFGFDPSGRDGRVPFALAQAVKLGEEVGELHAEVLGALQYQRSDKADRYNRDTLAGELGDVMVCVALLADAFGVDLAEAVGSKIAHLEARNRPTGISLSVLTIYLLLLIGSDYFYARIVQFNW